MRVAAGAWRMLLRVALPVLAGAFLSSVFAASPGRSSVMRTIDWHRLGPIWIGEPRATVESRFGVPGAPGSRCRVAPIGRRAELPVECTIGGGGVWIDYSRWVGNCGPAKGCDRPRSCGLEGACRQIVTSRVQTIGIGGLIPGKASSTRLTFDGVGLGDPVPLGRCVKTSSSRCAHVWNGLRFKRTFLEGVGYWASWQGRVVRDGLRMWVSVYTTKGKISSIWVERY
jgi:hypothetical protein